jgi:DNA repair exonuclease SbcCD nuclease subunit
MTFNIAHFSDTHLGYRAQVASLPNGTNIRVQDGYNALKEIVHQIVSSDVKIDVAVMSGDMFHFSKPTIKDIAIAQHYTRELARHGVRVYVLAGNHDATDIRSELAANAVIHDPDKGIHSLYEPYKKYELDEGLFLHSVAHHGLSLEDTPTISANPSDINIFTTHGAALDPKNQELLRCVDSPREQIVPMDLILDDVFSAKLLGHYHSRYAIGGGETNSLNTVYAGSTVRRGFSDDPGERGWWLVQVEVDGTVKMTPKNIKQRPQYDLKPIEGDSLSAGDLMDLIEANLEGTDQTTEAPIIRQKIFNVPRSVRLGLDKERIKELSSHALQWQLEFSMDALTAKENSEVTKKAISFGQKADLQGQFTDWVQEFKDTIPAEFRDIAIKGAEEYLKNALEKGMDKHVHN